MLESLLLPPIARSTTHAIASFHTVPRKHVKTNMQDSEYDSQSRRNELKSARNLRKNKDSSTPPISSPIGNAPSSGLNTFRPSNNKAMDTEDFAEDDGTAGSATSTEHPDCQNYICLCQPEPKIPRPRNAFILYRQHHQQAIIARHPGLHNPDISKIIGEQWKAESVDQKKVWQDLALKEKARHQEQYPDYRYQPRRVGRSKSLSTSAGQSLTVDKYRCARCGGRSIKTPTTPFLDSSGTPTLPPPVSDGLTPTTRYLPMTNHINIEPPMRRRGHGPSSLSNIHVPSATRDDPVMYSPLTPNKKRRFEYGPPSSNGRRQEPPYYLPHSIRESLPPLQAHYSPPNSAGMAPPRSSRDVRGGSAVDVDPSIQESNSGSLEEVLSNWTYMQKIKLLGRITPPAPNEHRGAIIAVEGDDLVSVRELSEWLKTHLAKEDEYSPRLVEPPEGPRNDGKPVALKEYLDLIRTWHDKSTTMINCITTTALARKNAMMPDKESEDRRRDSKKSTTPPDSPAEGICKKAVVILPTFQLHASMAYASRIPIRDAYSPTDHWQWMATMWRGTVGPDVTVYVTTYDAKEGQTGAKPSMDESARCLTVYKEREGKFMDSDLRRVGFEVTEWMKGMGCSGKSA